MSRRVKIFSVIAGLVIFAIIMRHNKVGGEGTKSPVINVASTPQPAAAPTVAAPTATAPKPKKHSSPASEKKQRTKPHTEKAKEKTKEKESSNLTPGLRVRVTKVVGIYSSWPGSTPKQQLLKGLKNQRPFITDAAIAKIEAGWQDVPTTFKLKVRKVNLEPGFFAAKNNPNEASLTAYVTLLKHFTPVAKKPYDKSATQPITVKLRIINRKWTVVEIAPQSESASVGA
jgi:hypothetical protein